MGTLENIEGEEAFQRGEGGGHLERQFNRLAVANMPGQPLNALSQIPNAIVYHQPPYLATSNNYV